MRISPKPCPHFASRAYDSNGNTVTKAGTQTDNFGWDAENRLNAISGGVVASYGYDYQGRRNEKTVGTTTSFMYDGQNRIQDVGQADYLFGPGMDEPLAMSRGGSMYYYAVDALGSVNLVTNASGTVQDSGIYDAWGIAKSVTGSLANDFGYTARESGEAGTLFYRARYYNPSIGRFQSEDPVKFRTIESWYAYVENTPAIGTDPTGRVCPSCCNAGAIQQEKAKMWMSANRALAIYLGSFLFDPVNYIDPLPHPCEDYASVVLRGVRAVDVKCWAATIAESADTVPFNRYQPSHMAVALKPCSVESWNLGVIWDAWPSGYLTEYPFTNWKPGFVRHVCKVQQ